MTQDELCVLLVGRVNESLNKGKNNFIISTDIIWNDKFRL